MANRPRRNRNRVTRLSLGAGRLVLRPTRAVAGDMLEPVAEAAVDHALAGPLPEAIAHSLVEHRVIERIVREMLATGDLSRLEQALDDEALERTVERVLASPRTERLIGDAIERALASDAIHRVLTSPEFEHLLTETMSSPAVRNAIAEQTVTLGDEMVHSTRAAVMQIDERVDLRHTKPAAPYAGVATRGAALLIDALLANLVFLICAAGVALIASLAGGFHHGWVLDTIAAAGWALVQIVYFVGYWSTVGRTPGMHLMGVRVCDRRGRTPGFFRSFVRLVGLWLAIAIAFLGFVPALFDRRRRALQDFLAGTEVVYDDRALAHYLRQKEKLRSKPPAIELQSKHRP